MTRPSIERPTEMVSGEIEPLAKAKRPPAMPQMQSGNGEADPVHALDVDADGFCAQRRVAARAHGVAERREQHSAQQQHREHGEGERKQVIVRRRVERRRRPYADDAVRSAGHVLPLVDDRPDDLREGERQHGEINARQPDGEPAEQQGARERGQRCEGNRAEHRHGDRISPAAQRHKRRDRNRRHGRTNACRPVP